MSQEKRELKLYKILNQHAGPKSSRTGIFCYLVAKDDEEVYETIKEGLYIDRQGSNQDSWLHCSWEDREGESEADGEEFTIYLKEDGEEGYWDEENQREASFKEWVLYYKGDWQEDGSDYYYGVNWCGWEFVRDITLGEARELQGYILHDLLFAEDILKKRAEQEAENAVEATDV